MHSEVAKGNFSVSCIFFTTGLAKNKTKFSFIKAHKVLVSISVLYIAYNVSLTALKKGTILTENWVEHRETFIAVTTPITSVST